VLFHEVLDGVLDLFGSRLGVRDSLDGDDVSTSMGVRKLIPDGFGIRPSSQRFGEIVGGFNLVALHDRLPSSIAAHDRACDVFARVAGVLSCHAWAARY
jgi:hypothetical protein